MKNFIDTATKETYSFDDDVTFVKNAKGGYTFTAADGTPLRTPPALRPYDPPAADAAKAAAALKAAEAATRLAAIRAVREVVLNRITGVRLNTSDVAVRDALIALRTSLLDVTKADDVFAAWETIRSNFVAENPALASLFNAVSLPQ